VLKRQYLSLAALGACFFSLTVIGLGAFTRLMDAGLGCPDWPGCYGHLTAPMTAFAREQALSLYPTGTLDVFKAWAEMIHRYFAGNLGLMILVILCLIFSKELRSRGNIVLGASILGLLLYQILLGQWTVTYKLLPIVVTQHLLGGFLILAVLWLIYLNNSDPSQGRVLQSKGVKIGAVIGLILVLLQIFLGAWTSTNYASFSCPDFPFCLNTHPLMTMNFSEAFTLFTPIGINYEGGVLSEGARQTIQMTHRLGALLVTLYLLVFTVFFMKNLRANHGLLKSIYLIWGLLFIQLCLGIVNVIYKLPLVTAIGHNLIAVVLLLSMVTLVFKLFVKGK
jgi:cytochrome c oxidase assembly protein subunit 15